MLSKRLKCRHIIFNHLKLCLHKSSAQIFVWSDIIRSWCVWSIKIWLCLIQHGWSDCLILQTCSYFFLKCMSPPSQRRICATQQTRDTGPSLVQLLRRRPSIEPTLVNELWLLGCRLRNMAKPVTELCGSSARVTDITFCLRKERIRDILSQQYKAKNLRRLKYLARMEHLIVSSVVRWCCKQ